MKYKFDKCHLDPTDPDFIEIASDLLKKIKDASLLKYIVIMYDPESPVRRRVPEMNDRIRTACEISGYTVPEERMNDKVVAAIILYLRMVNNLDWSMIVAIENNIWESMSTMLTPITKSTEGTGNDKDVSTGVKIKNGLVADLLEMKKHLTVLKKSFYGDDELEKIVSEKPQLTSSEAIAKALRN